MLVTNIIGDPLLEQSAKRFHLYLKKAGLDGRGEPVGRPRKPCKLKNTPSIVIIIIIIIRVGKPEIVFIEVVIIDVAIPGDERVKDKELEKIEKYRLLKDEFAKVWHTWKVIVVPVVIGALGATSVNFKEYVKRIGVNVRLEVIQKTALLGTAKIPRKVLSLY